MNGIPDSNTRAYRLKTFNTWAGFPYPELMKTWKNLHDSVQRQKAYSFHELAELSGLLQSVLKWLCGSSVETIRLVQNGDQFFHYDNAPAHTAISVHDFLASNRFIAHPTYRIWHSVIFFSFPQNKIKLKGERFTDILKAKRESKVALQDITKNEYKRCFVQ